VGARQFEVAASLTGSLTGPAAMNVPAIAMPFEFGFGKVGHDVVVELSRGSEVGAAAIRALLGVNVVLEEQSAGRRFGAKNARMFTVLLPPSIVGSPLPRFAFAFVSLAALQKGLDLVFELGNPLAQLGVLGFEFRNPEVTRVVHDRIACQKAGSQES
jgi:hypothetical protein